MARRKPKSKSKKSSADKVYQLKVTLRGSKPPIWRRLLVPADTSLLELHRIIQVAMGWEGAHLHQFIIDGQFYSTSSEDDWESVMDERKYDLTRVAPVENSKFIYEYDFGDSWEHQIRVEKILPADPNETYPRCIKGKRACPPEDVGGIWGYQEFLDALRDPNHPEHESYLEWVGDDFDPEYFDLEGVNSQLERIDEITFWDEIL